MNEIQSVLVVILGITLAVFLILGIVVVTIAIKILNGKINKFADLLKIARLADSLSRLNVRSKNRRKNFTAMIQENPSSNDWALLFWQYNAR